MSVIDRCCESCCFPADIAGCPDNILINSGLAAGKVVHVWFEDHFGNLTRLQKTVAANGVLTINVEDDLPAGICNAAALPLKLWLTEDVQGKKPIDMYIKTSYGCVDLYFTDGPLINEIGLL